MFRRILVRMQLLLGAAFQGLRGVPAQTRIITRLKGPSVTAGKFISLKLQNEIVLFLNGCLLSLRVMIQVFNRTRQLRYHSAELGNFRLSTAELVGRGLRL